MSFQLSACFLWLALGELFAFRLPVNSFQLPVKCEGPTFWPGLLLFSGLIVGFWVELSGHFYKFIIWFVLLGLGGFGVILAIDKGICWTFGGFRLGLNLGWLVENAERRGKAPAGSSLRSE
jgi:hypothetical protein